MSLKFEEVKIEAIDGHQQLKIAEMSVGESIWFMWLNSRDARSAEYGDFTIMQGLLLDKEASNEQELEASAVAGSFVPNTMLLNAVAQGALCKGFVYKIVKKWSKDDVFAGKKARGHGFELFKLQIPEPLLQKLNKKYLDLTKPLSPDANNIEAAAHSNVNQSNMPKL